MGLGYGTAADAYTFVLRRGSVSQQPLQKSPPMTSSLASTLGRQATGVAAGARLLPMSQLSALVGEIPLDPKKPVYLICNTQNRSSATLRALRQRGYAHVRYVSGGMSEWARRGWPMVKAAT